MPPAQGPCAPDRYDARVCVRGVRKPAGLDLAEHLRVAYADSLRMSGVVALCVAVLRDADATMRVCSWIRGPVRRPPSPAPSESVVSARRDFGQHSMLRMPADPQSGPGCRELRREVRPMFGIWLPCALRPLGGLRGLRGSDSPRELLTSRSCRRLMFTEKRIHLYGRLRCPELVGGLVWCVARE